MFSDLFIEKNIRCEWVNHYYYVCYCYVSTADNGIRAITLNGTGCALKNECLTNNGGCAQTCTDQTDGFQCGCFAGPTGYRRPVWTLSDNTFDCHDIDECAVPAFVDENCASPGKCVNTPGFYKCIQNTAISKSGVVAAGKILELSSLIYILLEFLAVFVIPLNVQVI